MDIEISINTNEYVECELTEFGKVAISQRGFKPEFKGKTNFIKIQLWELMNSLGDAMFNGAEQSIVGNRITYVESTSKPWDSI